MNAARIHLATLSEAWRDHPETVVCLVVSVIALIIMWCSGIIARAVARRTRGQ